MTLFSHIIFKDILDNLENVESCDLEEDDLMLDLDLSEDASYTAVSDGINKNKHPLTFNYLGWGGGLVCYPTLPLKPLSHCTLVPENCQKIAGVPSV